MAANDPLIGSTVGGCLILEVIGQGGMGVIYKSRQKSLDRIVALKVLAPHLANDAGFVGRFQREARSIARVNHPNILAVYDVGDDQNVNYMIMELIDGQSLAELQTERRGAIPYEEACNYIKQASQGLEAAQSAGIIHRDIKPENLMVTKKGVVKVSDFGLAKESDASNTSIDAVMGTPAFMSPEQCDGKKVDGRSDIYSLGGTFYRLITGRLPFEAETAMSMMYRHKHEALIPPHEVVSSLPQPISAVIVKMMAKKREQRYQTMTEVIDALEAAMKAGSAPVIKKAEAPPAARMVPVPVPGADEPLGLPPAQNVMETGIMSRRDSVSGIQLRPPAASNRMPVPTGNSGFAAHGDSSRMNMPSGVMGLAPPGMAVPDDAYTNVSRGDEMMGRGDRLGALKCYRLALGSTTLDAATRGRIEQEMTREATTRRQAAENFMKKAQLVEAQRECRILIEIDPNDEMAKALFKDIETKLSQKRSMVNDIRTAIAVSEFEKAIKIWDSTHSELRDESLGKQIEQLRNKVVPSIKLAQQGDMFSKQGRLEEGISSYEDALKLNPTCEQARIGLKDTEQKLQRIEFMLKEGYQLSLEQNFAKAVETWKPILALRPGHPQAVKSIVDACIAHAQNLRAQGDVENAWIAYKTACDTDPQNKAIRKTFEELTNLRDKEQALVDRAQDATAKGRLGEAIGYWKEVQRINPPNKKAAQQVAQLGKQRSGGFAKALIVLVLLGAVGGAGYQYYMEMEGLKPPTNALTVLRDAPSLPEAHKLIQTMDLPKIVQNLENATFLFQSKQQLTDDLKFWLDIARALRLHADGNLPDAEKLFFALSKSGANKDRSLQDKLRVQGLECKLQRLEDSAAKSLGSLNFKDTLDTLREIKLELEGEGVPETLKSKEVITQDKITVMQKIMAGERYEKETKKLDASKEYTAAQTLQERLKLPGLDDWLKAALIRTGVDLKLFNDAVKLGKAALKKQPDPDIAAAMTQFKVAFGVNPMATDVNAYLDYTSDLRFCDNKGMALYAEKHPLRPDAEGQYTRVRVFCIDRYEFPNKKGSMPRAELSYVEAQKECKDVGKQLCKRIEWEDGCKGGERFNFLWPFGMAAAPGVCNSGGTAAVASGSKEGCKNFTGTFDMSGNLAEWVESDGDNASVMGGAFDTPSTQSNCQDFSLEAKANGSKRIGFRCCKSVPEQPEKP